MAYIRYKGPYAYLVYAERFGEGSKVRQKVLYYFGREVKITEGIIAEVEAKFPDIEIDWASLSAEIRRSSGNSSEKGDWLEWD